MDKNYAEAGVTGNPINFELISTAFLLQGSREFDLNIISIEGWHISCENNGNFLINSGDKIKISFHDESFRLFEVIEVEHIYHAYCEFVVEEIFHYKKDGIIMNYSVDNSVHINNNMNIDSGTHITGNNNITGANNTVANSFNNNDLEVIDQLIRVLRNTNEEKIEKVIKIAEELKTTPKKQKTEKIKQILKFGGKIVEVALPFLQKLLSNV